MFNVFQPIDNDDKIKNDDSYDGSEFTFFFIIIIASVSGGIFIGYLIYISIKHILQKN